MRSVLLQVAAVVALSFTPCLAHAETHDIPLDMSGVRPAVSVTLNGGAPELWTFDTGAMGNVMNIDRARALNLPEQQPVMLGSPAGGTPMQGFLTSVPNVNINGWALPPLRMVAAPSLLPGRGGVLSPNAFSGQLVTFDFAHNLVHVADKTPANIPHLASTAYTGNGPHSLPSIPVVLGAQTWTAHIDTGSPGALTFPYSLASTLPLAAPPTQVGVARFVDGEHARYAATLNGTIQVGPLTLTNPQIGFIDGLPTLNIGMQLLNQMTITLDPAEQRSWAIANPH